MQEQELLDLLKDMSLDEKINQMVQLNADFYDIEENGDSITGPMLEMGLTKDQVWQAGSVLGTVGAAKIKKFQKVYMEHQPHHIPLLFMADVINGYRTIFPMPLAQGCTFDPELVRKMASVSARETARAGLHLTFSPMSDLARDARWGRVLESTGEDPYLNCCMTSAMVKGYQGEDVLKEDHVAACVKHFAAYGAPLGGRDYNQVELSERTLREDYLPAYKAGVDAGALMIMTSFNTLGRVPSTANKALMRGILRDEWGFDGVVISDWAAIWELLKHGIAEEEDEAAALAVKAGVDIDMMTEIYANHLKKLVEEGKVEEKLIDEAAYRILRLKNRLGLFENPYKNADEVYDEALEIEEEHRALARVAAAESFVLLKNDGILPLVKKADAAKNSQHTGIALIGPYVREKQICGSWSLFWKQSDLVTVEEGIRKKEPDKNMAYAKGCEILGYQQKICGFGVEFENTKSKEELEAMMQEAVETAKKAETVILFLGEHYQASGESASQTEIQLPAHQLELLDRVYEVNPQIVVVTFSGRPLDLRHVAEKAKAVLHVWFPGIEGGNAIADVLFGDQEPGGRLAMCFPYTVGQVPVYYSELHTGRRRPEGEITPRGVSGYLDAPNHPLYAFGYGLTYTSFAYSEISLSSEIMTREESLTAKIMVQNTGSRAGTEVVQLYIRDVAGSVARPVRELKGFQRIILQPGESREVTFEITEKMLRFYNIDMEYVAEPGRFEIYIGGNSDAGQKAEFRLV